MTTPKVPNPAPKPLPIRQQVLDCVMELHAANRLCTVERVAEKSGLKISQVSESFEALVESKKLHRVARGMVEPAQVLTTNPVTTTAVGTSHYKIEVGNQEMMISTTEARNIARQLCGLLVRFDVV